MAAAKKKISRSKKTLIVGIKMQPAAGFHTKDFGEGGEANLGLQ